MGSRGGDRRRRWRRWVAEEEIGGGDGEKIGGAECLGGISSRGGDRRRWVVEEEIGGRSR